MEISTDGGAQAPNDRIGTETLKLDQMMPLIYEDLCGVARRYVSRESPGFRRQAAAVVNEAYLRLAGCREPRWRSADHLFRTAARTIRRTLIDHARRQRCGKRGGGLEILSLDETRSIFCRDEDEARLALQDALDDLARSEPRLRRVVGLLYFTGLTQKEAALKLGIGRNTVQRDWCKARQWLHQRLNESTAGGADEDSLAEV